MALTQRLEIRQSHALVMTPQLMQAIKLLQLSNLELASYVEAELERNPLLERTGEGADGRPPDEASAERPPTRDSRTGGEWQGDGRGIGTRRRSNRGFARSSNGFDESRRGRRARAAPRCRRAIPNGPGRHRSPRATATTISKPSSRSRRRLRIISPSSLRSRSPIRPAA